MKIRILKDHPAGLVKGDIKTPIDSVAKKLIANGLAEEVKATRKPSTKKEK